MKHHSISTFAALVCQLILVCFTCVSGQEANSLLWRVTARNGQVSHLYGTYHTNIGDVFMFRQPAIQAFLDAKVVALEIQSAQELLENPHVLIAALSTIASLKESTASWKISESDRTEIGDSLKSIVKRLVPMLCKIEESSFYEIERKYGYTSTVNAAIRAIKTDSAAYLIGLVAMLKSELDDANRKVNSGRTEASDNGEILDFLDSYLSTSADNQGKEKVELDDLRQLLTTLPSMIGNLSEPMSMVRDTTASEELILEYYLREDIIKLYTIMRNALDRKTLQEMLDTRNRKWIVKLKPLLESKSCFVAVGAGHLAGEYGLIKLLRSNGLKVEPVLGGERVDIRKRLGNTVNLGTTNPDQSVGTTGREASFKSSLENAIRSHLQATNQHGLLTLMISVTRRNENSYDENDQFSIDFTDREDMLSQIMTIVRRTASSSDTYRKLDVNQTYNIVIQLEY